MIGKFEYCPLCAARLEDRRLDTEDKMRPVCPRCGFIHYDNPTPAARYMQVDLVKREDTRGQ